MKNNNITLSEQIKAMALKLNKAEFSDWLHKQIVGLAEYMQTVGIPNSYDVANRYVLNKVHEATLE